MAPLTPRAKKARMAVLRVVVMEMGLGIGENGAVDRVETLMVRSLR